jgi:hypothetical protein
VLGRDENMPGGRTKAIVRVGAIDLLYISSCATEDAVTSE